MDHLWSVVQEAANAPQPHQILFVFQLKTQNDFLFLLFDFSFCKGLKDGFMKACVSFVFLHHTSLVMSLTW